MHGTIAVAAALVYVTSGIRRSQEPRRMGGRKEEKTGQKRKMQSIHDRTYIIRDARRENKVLQGGRRISMKEKRSCSKETKKRKRERERAGKVLWKRAE